MSQTWSLREEIEIAREDLRHAVAAARAGEAPWQEVRRALGVVESLVTAQVKLAEARGEEDDRVLTTYAGLPQDLLSRLGRGEPVLPNDLPEEVVSAVREWVGREGGNRA